MPTSGHRTLAFEHRPQPVSTLPRSVLAAGFVLRIGGGGCRNLPGHELLFGVERPMQTKSYKESE